MADRSLFSELRERKVVQVAAIYGAVAWGLTEVVVTIVQQLFLPQWVSTLAVIFFVVGFPVAMFLAWTFDITPDGIRRTEIKSGRGTASIVFSMVLLVAGTAGLFFLIRPAMEQRAAEVDLAAPPNSVAVLQFDNATANPDDDHRSSGLSDALREQLGRVSELRIAARSSSIAIVGGGLDARGMSERLGVAHLVEGSLRRDGDLLIVSVQLINGRSGLAEWTETFRRGASELLNVQQEIAEAVVQNVLPDFAGEIAAPATLNLTAYDLMLLAGHYEQQVRDRQTRDDEKLQRAIDLYRQAIQADPQSALAHSRLASALLYIGDVAAAEEIIAEALYLNPYLSEVHNTLGELFWVRGDPRAGQAYEEAISLNPDNVHALHNYAKYLWFTQKLDGVAGLYRRALANDRESLGRYAALGEFLAVQEDPNDALEIAQEIETRFEGAESYRVIARLMELTGRLDESIAWTIRARNIEPDNPDHVWQLAALYAQIGDYATALKLEPEPAEGLLLLMRRYEELVDLAEEKVIDHPEDLLVRYTLGFGYSATGEYELAARMLKSTGLLEAVQTGMIRQSIDTEMVYTLAGALMRSGKREEAQDVAQYNLDYGFPSQTDWWSNFHVACALVILDRVDEALNYVRKIPDSTQIARNAYLRDAVCMQEIADTSEYRQMLQLVDERRATLRKQLPETLERFGVSL